MKKYCIHILLVIILFCTGCSTSNENQTAAQNIPTVSSILSDESLYKYTADESQNYWGSNGNNYIKKVENGYYYIYEDLLYYFDKTSETSTVVCSSLDCSHNTSDCSAYFGDYGDLRQYGYNTMGFEIYDNNIYIIGYEMNEVCDFYLYRVNLDGSEREKICYLYSAEKDEDGYFSYGYTLTMHNGCFYGTVDQENGWACLGRISADGEITTISDYSDKEYFYIGIVRCYGNYVYYNVSSYSDEDYNDYNSDLYRYNIDTEETELVIEDFFFSEGYLLIDEENILYLNSDNEFNIININTEDKTTVLEWNEEYCNGFSYDGIYIYIIDMSSDVCIYDTAGNFVDKITCGTCLFGDSEYLFVEAGDEPGAEQSGNGWGLWALDKSQLGSENKEWIMLGYTD